MGGSLPIILLEVVKSADLRMDSLYLHIKNSSQIRENR